MRLSFNTAEALFQRGFNDAECGRPAMSTAPEYLDGYRAGQEYHEFTDEQGDVLTPADYAAIHATV